MKLIPPADATEIAPKAFQSHHVAELKYDGCRYIMYIGECPYGRRVGTTLLSRRQSRIDGMFVDKTDNVPHIAKAYPNLNGTVLDGEIYLNDFLTTTSIMGSLPEKALIKQLKHGLIQYHVFDIMVHNGVDVREKSFQDRRALLETVVAQMNSPHVNLIAQTNVDIEKYFLTVTSQGGEGLMLKDLRKPYGQGWAKMKKSYDVSTIITGFKAGKGKYLNHVGSVAVSVHHNGELVEIGYVSGFSNKIRNEMTQDFAKFKGRVVDVFAQEIHIKGKSLGRLRHGTFSKFRDDVPQDTCTYEKLIKDFGNSAKVSRGKEASYYHLKDKYSSTRNTSGTRGSADKWRKAAEFMVLALNGIQGHLTALGIDRLPKDLRALVKARNEAIRRVHPDIGGSDKDAAAVNAAFEALKKTF